MVEALREAARAAGRPLVLDGELVALVRGKPARFQEIQDRVHLGDEAEGRRRADGRQRQPVFLGVRDDKDAREVGPEGRSVQGG